MLYLEINNEGKDNTQYDDYKPIIKQRIYSVAILVHKYGNSWLGLVQLACTGMDLGHVQMSTCTLTAI